MRLSERKLAIFTGLFFAAAMTNISMNGDRIVSRLARMAERPADVALTSSQPAAPVTEPRAGDGLVPLEVIRLPGMPPRPENTAAPRSVAALGERRSVLRDADTAVVLPKPPAEAALPAPLPMPPRDHAERMAARATPVSARPLEEAGAGLNAFGMVCTAHLSVEPLPGAMVALDLSAPCRAGQEVEIHHSGLRFAQRIGADGRVEAEVPALVQDAAFRAVFQDGETLTAGVPVPDAASLRRVAVQWEGASELLLHALEFGAEEGSSGHVWPGAPRSAALALASGGGFLTLLGDSGLDRARRVQVYSLPLAGAPREGTVELILEASGDGRACATEVEAQALHPSTAPGGPADALDITFVLPPCDEPGQILLLKNIIGNLKIARN